MFLFRLVFLRLAVLAVLLAPLPSLAQANPRSIGECERLKNDLAYNQCLAMFGPAARNVAGGFASADPSSAAAVAAVPAQAEEAAAPSGRRGVRARRGRQSAVFAAGGETRGSRYRRRRR